MFRFTVGRGARGRGWPSGAVARSVNKLRLRRAIVLQTQVVGGLMKFAPR
jgi:hypothetical protein